jgi:D-glycero-beta-D-manno-heptose 1-phosphate adenylyltransferase
VPPGSEEVRATRSGVEAAERARAVQAHGGRVVFTNGVFDLLHIGHVRYLRAARALGDLLIVALNSDRSARGLNKAPGRPINTEDERAEVVRALGSVDVVVIFDEDTPHAVISLIQPDILVKGADWRPDNIIGRDVVESRGGRVVRLDLTPGHSTTELIRRVRGLRRNQREAAPGGTSTSR